jgi:energy-coupling factor transporter transmembrane protein EcfT
MPHVMKGGFREQVDDLYHKYEQPVVLLVGLLMVLVIVFLDKIPIEIRKQADSFLGRALLVTFTITVTLLYGWPMGILAGLMSALVIGAGGVHPIVKEAQDVKQVNEGFSSEMQVRLIPDKHKWFVEKVLGENPLLIEDQTVDTSAVQDLSEKYSGSVQSNTVTR